MTYKYDCKACGKLEVEQKISEDPLGECPRCGGPCKRVPFTGDEANGAFKINGLSYKNGYTR